MFESETILGPYGAREWGDDVQGATEFFHQRGLPKNIYLFHRGTWLSGVEAGTGYLILLEPEDLSVRGRYRDLDEWYLGTVRPEFAWRYGLA